MVQTMARILFFNALVVPLPVLAALEVVVLVRVTGFMPWILCGLVVSLLVATLLFPSSATFSTS